eukprot:1143575-Pelagomonas_calceolata.AAC.3
MPNVKREDHKEAPPSAHMSQLVQLSLPVTYDDTMLPPLIAVRNVRKDVMKLIDKYVSLAALCQLIGHVLMDNFSRLTQQQIIVQASMLPLRDH